MAIEGYVDYKRREFCKNMKCPVQSELDLQEEGTAEYEKIRSICKAECKYTTYQFHQWLIGNGYLILRPEAQNQ